MKKLHRVYTLTYIIIHSANDNYEQIYTDSQTMIKLQNKTNMVDQIKVLATSQLNFKYKSIGNVKADKAGLQSL